MKDFLSKKSLKKTKNLFKPLKKISTIQAIHIIVVCIVLDMVLLVVIAFLMNKIQLNALNTLQEGAIYKTPLPYVSSDVSVNAGAKALVVYDPSTRTIVYGKNYTFRFSPASTAKIMTATLALEHYNLNAVIAVNGVSTVVGSKMGLVEGEQMSIQNLLYGLMLPSGNDAAFVLASNYPGGYHSFVKKMNEKAKELYLYNTHFVDPAGYDDANYTTAQDLARLAAYAMTNTMFRKIVSTKHILVFNTQKTIPHDLTNLNELLGMKGIEGVKTGFTNEAGEVLVTAYDYQGKMYIIVVLNSSDRFGDTEKVINDVVDKIQLISY